MEETIQQLVYRRMYDVCQEYDLGVSAYFRLCKATEAVIAEALALPHSPASASRPEKKENDHEQKSKM